ncbi:MAG: MFS transporter [Fusobacteriaceae bacterium]
MKLVTKLGFNDNYKFFGFLTVAMSGQIIYSAFEAFKWTFYNLLLVTLEITNTQLGVIFSLIGIAMFFYVPAGWINSRFPIKNILIAGLLIRLISLMWIIFVKPSFTTLSVIATIWGLTDSFFWPAVMNGVSFMAGKNAKGMAYGIFESLRRAAESGMNLLIVGVMASFGCVTHRRKRCSNISLGYDYL